MVVPIALTIIDGFASRAAPLFRDYAIVGANFEVRCGSQTSVVPTGIIAAFIDEESAAAPAAAAAMNRPRLDILPVPQTVPGAYRLKWSPRDLQDLDYMSNATTVTLAWLKLYTDVGNFGANATAGAQIQVVVTGTLRFWFRGYN